MKTTQAIKLDLILSYGSISRCNEVEEIDALYSDEKQRELIDAGKKCYSFKMFEHINGFDFSGFISWHFSVKDFINFAYTQLSK